MTVVSRLALGLAASLAIVAAPVSAGGWYGGGHGGYHHYHRGGNGGDIAAALIGGLLVGGLIGAASSANQPNPAQGYYNAPPQGYGQSGYAQPGYAQPGYSPQVYAQQGGAQPTYATAYNAAPPAADAASAQIEMCARAAERAAQGYGGLARVVAIDGINGEQGNAEVRGSLEINRSGSATRTGFTCSASFGQVTGVRLG